MGGATCAESPVPSVASEELAVAKRWTSLALVMQVDHFLLTKSFTETSLADLPHLLGGRAGDGCCGACPQYCSVLACLHTGAEHKHCSLDILYTKVEPMMVMVPALLGLKGNLEMTLASRLSTVGC